jgi:EmrB/QacA subfamily drug resistance transporter
MPALRRTNHATIALAVILACQAMIILDGTVVNVALPNVQRDLGLTPAGLSWVLNAYVLAFGGLILLGGRAADLLGPRRTFSAGVALFTAASLAGGLAGSAGLLLVARALQGVGGALAAPAVLGLIATTFAEGPARNRTLGAFSAVSAAGASLGLLLGGVLTAWASWRWVLFINVPVGVAVLALTPRYVPAPAPRRDGPLDVAGAALSTAGMVAVVYGFIRVGEEGWGDGLALGLFAAAAVLVALFVAVERRAARPVLPLRLLADRRRAAAYVAMTVVPAAMFGMFFFLTQFLQDVLGYSPLQTGLAFLPMTALLFAIPRAVPALLPRVGATPFLVGGPVLLTVGMAWLSGIDPASGYPFVLVAMLLLGVGAGSLFMPLSMVILSGVPNEDAGAASGALQAAQQLGGAIGVGVLVTVFGTATGHVAAPSPAVLADGMSQAFVAAAGFGVAGVVAAVVLSWRPAAATAAAAPRRTS